MNKKFLAVLFFFLMLISLLPSGAMAAEAEYTDSLEITIPGGYTLKAVKYTHSCGNAGMMKTGSLVIKDFKRTGHTAEFEISVKIKCDSDAHSWTSVMTRATSTKITIIDDCKQEADTLFSIDGGNMGGEIDFILTSPAVGGDHISEKKYDADNHWDGCSKCSLQKNISKHSLVREYDAAGHWDYCSDSKCDYKSSATAHSPVVKFDINGHWDDCSGCDYVSAPVAHSPVVKFDAENHWAGCSKCDLKENITEHIPVQKYDEANHWIGCSKCNHQRDITPHSPVVLYNEEGHWDDCSGCDYESSIAPHFTIVEFDTENHWNGCSNCDHQQDITPHSMQVSGRYHICSGCDHMIYIAPATGDSMNLMLWIGLMAISAAGAVLFIRRSRKEY